MAVPAPPASSASAGAGSKPAPLGTPHLECWLAAAVSAGAIIWAFAISRRHRRVNGATWQETRKDARECFQRGTLGGYLDGSWQYIAFLVGRWVPGLLAAMAAVLAPFVAGLCGADMGPWVLRGVCALLQVLSGKEPAACANLP